MLKFNRKVEYALMAMIYLSQQPPEKPSNAREIGEIFSIPVELLGKVLQQLTQKGLISSVRGTKGGYFLEKKLMEISVHQVISVVERPINLVECAYSDCNCAQMSQCNIKNPMMILQGKLAQFFDDLTLQDLKEEQKIYFV